MTLVKFNPAKNNGSLIPGFNDVFDSVLNDTFFNDRLTSRVPAANISETEDHYHVELAAPGLKKEEFKLNLDGNVLNVAVERRNENNDAAKNYSKREYSYNSWVRSFTLPESANAESIEASYMDGVLKIDIAKREEAKIVRRQIEIK
ncbi:Hsp20/alpha crystallin family protein [Mucilaginibacter sp. Mucisp86]|uniref:Hsp20/alpha crystallin family protein n=1 Tax=Mucilaginibacter sp. Mucisp86 TaxID=3243060 RepID=UPI0039B41976